MLRRTLALSASAALTLGLAQVAAAAPADPPPIEPTKVTDVTRSGGEKGPVLALGQATERPELYIVRLAKPAVPTYDGGIEGVPAPRREDGAQLDATAAPAREYRSVLEQGHAELTASIERQTGRTPTVEHSYTNAINGIAVKLTRDEAREVAELPGVVSVQVDEKRRLQTDVGPEWIGAPAIWDGSGTPDGTATQGEGVVAGIIDSGINWANPSFADVVPASAGGDGYDHTNPLGAGNYVGVCDPANTEIFQPGFECNDKLIGAWGYTDEPQTPVDVGGHGSHTASTTAGNQVDATFYSARGTEYERAETRNIEGVAPHANIIAYDVCANGCSLAAITAAIDQAIVDGVDVINYSIGSPAASDPWADADALGFLNARAAGIYVATSAGNAGPGAATVGSPADVPWITSVGATQHNRQWQARVEDITADGGESLPDIQGLAFSAASDGVLPLVYAGDFGNPMCLAGEFEAGTDFTGEIVVCDRGTNGRVAKGGIVRDLGADGMILANDEASGTSLNADAHLLPAVHITYADGVALKEWMASVTGEQASLSGGIEVISAEVADIMAGFSSRGPNRAVDIVTPSLSAPGVDVLAAYGSDNAVEWAFVSGTSMASPHVAGSFALLKAVNGADWTPAEAQSALMMTSHTGVTDTDGSPADWFDMGSGRADLTVAANAGLVMDETYEDYLAANPAEGGDPASLNIASMADSQCLQVCSWTRTVTGTATGAGTWNVSTESITDGVEVSVTPSTFTVAEGESVELTITADVSGAPDTEDYQFGNVVLTHGGGTTAVPEAHLPVAVLPSTGVLPEDVQIDTRRDAGSQETDPLEAIEITDLDVQVAGLTKADEQELAISQDATNTDPYDGNGTETILVDVPEDAARLVASLQDSTAPDMDLFVGTGSEPSAATEVCASATATADEFCDVGTPEAGTWWILVQNWQASEDGTDTVTLGSAVVAGDQGNMRVEGPESQPTGEPFTLRVFYDEPALEAGQTWYGAVTLGSGPDSPGDIGTLPVTLNRFADDVTKTVSADTAAPGDTLTYTLNVKPNVTPEDLQYTITDTLPEGTTYVEGSATGGASVEDGVLTWEPMMPTAVGVEGDYTVTTSAQDDSCLNPFTGTAEYTDLAGFGIEVDPSIEGDGVAYTLGGTFGFYGSMYDGVAFTDDGFLIYDVESHYGGVPSEPQTLPDTAQPNNVAAMLWQDMVIHSDPEAGEGVSLGIAGDLSIIEYDNMRLYGDDGGALGTYDFEAFVTQGSNDVVFAYDNVTGPLDGPLTIGTENSAGSKATALVNDGSAAGVISDDTVVCATYAGPDLGATEITYQVTVDDDVADGQVLTNEAVHVTDNPGAEEVTVSTDVTVEGAGEPPVTADVTIEATRDAEEPSTDGVFTFTRQEDAAEEELTVSYSVRDVRAREGRDYEPLDGEVTFEAGETTTTEIVEVNDLRRRSPRGRTVILTIEDGDGYVVGDPASARIKIIDDWEPGRR